MIRIVCLLLPTAVLVIAMASSTTTASANGTSDQPLAQVELSANCDNPSIAICPPPPAGRQWKRRNPGRGVRSRWRQSNSFHGSLVLLQRHGKPTSASSRSIIQRHEAGLDRSAGPRAKHALGAPEPENVPMPEIEVDGTFRCGNFVATTHDLNLSALPAGVRRTIQVAAMRTSGAGMRIAGQRRLTRRGYFRTRMATMANTSDKPTRAIPTTFFAAFR